MQPVALVAGGTGNIGQVICRELHRSGVRVAVGYAHAQAHERAEALAAEIGGVALAVRAEEDSALALREVKEGLGSPDILINAAGINIEDASLAMRPQDWQSVLDVNLGFAFRLSQAAIPYMMARRYGRIVHLSSVAGRVFGRGQINYAASKAGLERMVRVLALEVGRKGITVNCVAPGIIESSMTAHIRSEHEQALLDHIACRRFGKPEEVAKAVVFLASEQASYINGAVLPVDGGTML